ncbi:MAG TPA: amidohydrolase [Vicinamibacterales bacterium]|jgi:5-methylthioadenosine/S-adenosylhomocysteine deaminase|nr:amidohydrolase [Vicinamibacterales bacterium]
MSLRGSLSLLVVGFLLFSQGQRQPVSLILTGGIVVTMDSTARVLSPGAVAIDGRNIVAVDAPDAISSRYSSQTVIDTAGQVVMPGLINTHTHAPMVLYRGLADDLALMDWLQKYIFPAEAKTVTPDFVRAGTRLAVLEMIESGTTTYADMYYFEEEVARVTREAGLRGVLGQTIIQFPVADAKTPKDGLTRTESFIKEFANDELIVPAVAPHSMYTLDSGTLKAARALADRAHVPVLIHLSETADEIKTSTEAHKASPTAYLESLGFWGPRTIAAHGVWLSPADMTILSRHHVAVSHNPESNMKLASGAAKVSDMQRTGLVVALGTDGAASNNDLDMFEAMRQAAFLAKLQTSDPRAVPARKALEMATIDGARALGMESLIGSLEAGKRADVITVSMTAARQTPMYDPLSHLVYVTRGDDVNTTIVNGRILMRDRKVMTLDKTRVLSDARALAEKVKAAVR